MKRKGLRWRVDWFGKGTTPENDQLVLHVSAAGTKTFARVTGVRAIANRSPLPAGASCRYLVTVERIEAASDDQVEWVFHGYPRSRKPMSNPFNDTMSPLL